MPSINFVVPGQSVAKARGRIVKLGKHMGIKTPDKTRRYEYTVREHAIRAWRDNDLQPIPRELAITLGLVFTREIPASWSKRKQLDALAGIIAPACKPDLDNLIKSVKDGCNGVAWVDDCQICDITATKRYGHLPGVQITVSW